MGGVGTPELAAAVADAGGLGMVSMVMAPVDRMTAELERLSTLTSGAVGINFLVPFLDASAIEAAASRCRVVEFFYGDPDPVLVKRVHQGGALASWQVGSLGEALSATEAGCDLVVAQGSEAGGHVRGGVALLPLLDAVLDGVDVPVVAAGGIATARGVAAVLAAGAAGARVGTRFVVSPESDAHPDYVRAILDAGGGDTVLTEAFGVMWPDAPHRVLRSCIAAAAALEGEMAGEVTIDGVVVPVQAFTPSPPTRATSGHIDAMPLYAGQGVGLVRAVEPAGEIVRELVEGASSLLEQRSVDG
jgi:NAD(P)H-dependent flavin oxidoreductase YrpB (nitropropane dioxygenase family)